MRTIGAVNGRYKPPLQFDLIQCRDRLDTANREVLRWLNEVANTRVHATTGVQLCVRLAEDQAQLSALPIRVAQSAAPISRTSVMPFESLQHRLSVYQALLENAA